MGKPDLHGWKVKTTGQYATASNQDGAKYEINSNGVEIVSIGDGNTFLHHDVIQYALDLQKRKYEKDNNLTPYKEYHTALATNARSKLACANPISYTPAGDGQIQVNEMQVLLRGDKTGDCYFSRDGGKTAKPLGKITAGDKLYWGSSNAHFDLDSNDEIKFLYYIKERKKKK